MSEDRQSLGEQIIDLDLFSGGIVPYRVTMADGTERRFEIPTDLPFPLAAAFQTAYDAWWGCQVAQLGAKTERTRKAGADRYADAYARMIETFGPIVRLRHSEVTDEDLRAGIGENAMAAWCVSVATKLDPTVWLEALGLLGPKEETPSPDPSPSPGSSAGSVGPTDGAMTTGARSGGSSSGSP